MKTKLLTLVIGLLFSSIGVAETFESTCSIQNRIARAYIYSHNDEVKIDGEATLVILDDDGDILEKHVKNITEYVSPHNERMIFDFPTSFFASECKLLFDDDTIEWNTVYDAPSKEVVHHYHHYENPNPVGVGLMLNVLGQMSATPHHSYRPHHSRVIIHRQVGPTYPHHSYKRVIITKPRASYRPSHRFSTNIQITKAS